METRAGATPSRNRASATDAATKIRTAYDRTPTQPVRKSGWEHDVEGRERFCRVVTKRGKWRLRPYAPGDEIEILDLCKRIFSSTLSLSEWRWRSLEHPPCEALVVVDEEKDHRRIIGHISAIPTDLKVGNFSRKGFFLVDSAVE